MHLNQPLPEAVDRLLDEGGALAVSLSGARQPFEGHRLAPSDRDRVEVAGMPVLAAVDRRRNDRHVPLERNPPRAGPSLAGAARALPRPLDEHSEPVPCPDNLS